MSKPNVGILATKDWVISLINKVIKRRDNGIIPHIDPITKNWFIGDVDTGVSAQGVSGNDGTTPHIGTNGNWFIGDTDTGVLAHGTDGKDGKSIQSITKDNDNNIIVTFTDGSTQNIGKLSVDIQKLIS